MITKNTAMRIALCYQEIERAETLLKSVVEKIEARRQTGFRTDDTDLRDVFGRRQRELQLGVPSGDNGHQLCGVSYDIALPVIEAHIANQRAQLGTLTALARAELDASREPGP